MSYVPATFTAGFALVLTAAGAAGGQWISDLQRSHVEAAPRRAHAQHEAAVAAREGFRARTAAYATLHAEVEKNIRALAYARDPKRITDREHALSDALIKARSGARAGEYFGDFATPLRRIIREEFTWRHAPDQKTLVQEVPPDVQIDINKTYPTALPLAEVPPALLRVVPELPKVLEYRVVGRDLILLDTKGHVVVDLLRNVFPA